MLWLIAAGLISAVILVVLYSCLIVASREDDAMEEFFRHKNN